MVAHSAIDHTGITGVGGSGGTELDYVEKTSNTSITATTEGTANTIVTGSAVAYDGSTVIIIKFSTALVVTSTSSVFDVWLYDGAASIGRLAEAQGSAAIGVPILVERRITPSAATHTYSIRASTGAGTATVVGGAGGIGVSAPAYIRIVTA